MLIVSLFSCVPHYQTKKSDELNKERERDRHAETQSERQDERESSV